MTDTAQTLLKIYRQDPCRMLPNAYWKTASRLDQAALILKHAPTGRLTAFAVRQDSKILAFWCSEPSNIPLSEMQLARAELALVHQDCLAVFSKNVFSHRQPFFRLIHKAPSKIYHCPEGFTFQKAYPEDEVDAVASIIRRCYVNMNVTPEVVKGWLAHPVYDPDLWLWVIEADSGQKVGLGIAELDPEVPEASLEWIQVLPQYRGLGLGRTIVAELLQRTGKKADFTTVSGRKDDPSLPESLYRKCGFTGSDVWWLLRA